MLRKSLNRRVITVAEKIAALNVHDVSENNKKKTFLPKKHIKKGID